MSDNVPISAMFKILAKFYKTKYNIPRSLACLEETRGIGISTRNRRLAAIHAFFRYIQYRARAGFEQCAEVLAVPFKKAPAAMINYMSTEEVTLLFSISAQKEGSQLRDFLGHTSVVTTEIYAKTNPIIKEELITWL